MGEQKVKIVKDQKQMQKFMKSLLDDVRAMETMLEQNWFENDIVRIGAEQEMVLVHKNTYKPACVAMEALEKLDHHPWITTELAKFNLEINLDPREFTGKCFSDMQTENAIKLNIIQNVLSEMDVSLVLTGILPTLRQHHLTMDNLTPKDRYFALMQALTDNMMGNNFGVRLEGLDELNLKHDSPLLEASNTSFQVHLQVPSHDFARQYNIAQALTAPLIAIGANSPIVFGKRLWHESRIALFQQALDTRTSHDHMRERSPRVTFGKSWINESPLDVYKEDITRFRVLLGDEPMEDSLDMVKNGKVPKLRSLLIHNSTVYRWNRPCYGISDNGKPHLRIESRVIPSGPTVTDEIANACFWLGMMSGMTDTEKDIRTKMSFDDVSDNFLKAAKFGIDSKFTWYNDTKTNAVDLVKNELLDLARHGLRIKKVDEGDIDLYLGIIEERAKRHMNGSRWLLRAYTDLKSKAPEDEAAAAVTEVIMQNQISGKCVHEWEMPSEDMITGYRPNHLHVSEFMTTDIFTVHENDIIDLVTEMMDWKDIRFVPVEDNHGKLVGLITTRMIIQFYLRNKNNKKQVIVKEIMISDPITIEPTANIVDALTKMQENKIGCLPVIQNNELIGIVTEGDFLRITSRLLRKFKAN
jgi:CBS domain-containing protein/gamma-glutamylcysteine synthetase